MGSSAYSGGRIYQLARRVFDGSRRLCAHDAGLAAADARLRRARLPRMEGARRHRACKSPVFTTARSEIPGSKRLGEDLGGRRGECHCSLLSRRDFEVEHHSVRTRARVVVFSKRGLGRCGDRPSAWAPILRGRNGRSVRAEWNSAGASACRWLKICSTSFVCRMELDLTCPWESESESPECSPWSLPQMSPCPPPPSTTPPPAQSTRYPLHSQSPQFSPQPYTSHIPSP